MVVLGRGRGVAEVAGVFLDVEDLMGVAELIKQVFLCAFLRPFLGEKEKPCFFLLSNLKMIHMLTVCGAFLDIYFELFLVSGRVQDSHVQNNLPILTSTLSH